MMLWTVAFADRTLDKHEDYVVRKVADLLYVPHRDVIRIRHGSAADHGTAPPQATVILVDEELLLEAPTEKRLGSLIGITSRPI